MLKFLLVSRELEDQKRQLALRQDFNLLDAFRYFDLEGQGMVDTEVMRQAFTLLGVKSTVSDIGLILC